MRVVRSLQKFKSIEDYRKDLGDTDTVGSQGAVMIQS